MTDADIVLAPIGWVRNEVKQPRPHGWQAVESDIELLPEHATGLEAIDAFTHIIVLFWLHRIPPGERKAEQLYPGPRLGLPLVGTFATREQRRPNPIGVAVVPLLSKHDATLHVRGLDAIDGTPVLDIKPYLPPFDAPPDARMPSWVWG